MHLSIRWTVLIVLVLSSVGCSWRQQAVQPSRHCDFVTKLALQPCEPLVLGENQDVGQAMLNWSLEYRQCQLKHAVLKACIEADNKSRKTNEQ